MKLALVRSNSYGYEHRLLGLHKSLSKEMQVIPILWDRKTKESAPNGARVLQVRAPLGIKMIVYLPIWFYHVIVSLVKIKPDAVYACNIESIIPAFLYAKVAKKRIIYDIWDTAGGMFAGSNVHLITFLNTFEKFFLARVAIVVVPDEERFDQLKLEKSKRGTFVTLYNSLPIGDFSKKIVFQAAQPIMLSYVGVMAKKVRGLEWLIEAVSSSKNVSLTIAGYGTDEDLIAKLVADTSSSNITYCGKVTYEKSNSINESSDFIVSLLDPEMENYKFATSTKLFEAFAMAKPIITTDGTATGSLTKKTGWGMVIPFTRQGVKKAIDQLEIESLRFQLESSRVKKYDWDYNCNTLIAAIQGLKK